MSVNDKNEERQEWPETKVHAKEAYDKCKKKSQRRKHSTILSALCRELESTLLMKKKIQPM